MFRVLVINDEPALLELTKAWLARSGEMQVETAALQHKGRGFGSHTGLGLFLVRKTGTLCEGTLIADWKELLEVLVIGGKRQAAASKEPVLCRLYKRDLEIRGLLQWADAPAGKNRWSGFRPYLRPYFLNIYHSPAATPAITKRPSTAT